MTIEPKEDRPRNWFDRFRWLFWLIIAIPVLYWAANATNIDIERLIRDAPKAQGIITDLLQPSLLTRGEEIQEVITQVEVPCVTGEGPVQAIEEGEPSIVLSSYCLEAREEIVVVGTGFRPNTSGRLYWFPPQAAGRLRDERFVTDDEGTFEVETDVPPLLAEQGGVSQLIALATWESGRLRPSDALETTIAEIIETIFLALMATTFGAILAVPLSFFGARNLVPRSPFGNAVYGFTRTLFNVTRAIEPLILATIFAIWVGFGPFAGVLALTLSTIANIGKLYSEAAEGIAAGPMEAVRATGANDIQTIWYAVVPQIVPPYLSFTIYYWDINVRMSTIIGFVGGGGIGFALQQWINQLQWNNAATGVWAIVIVVMTMDYISAIVRERLI